MDAVITQNPTLAMHDCLAIFRNLHARRPPLDGVQPTRSEILFRENLPV